MGDTVQRDGLSLCLWLSIVVWVLLFDLFTGALSLRNTKMSCSCCASRTYHFVHLCFMYRKRVGDEIFHFDFSKTFWAVAQTMDLGTESSSSTTSFLISVAEPYLSVPGFGKMIPPLGRLYSGRWLGHLRLVVLLWGYQNHAQRCCFAQSPGSLLAGMRACS